MKRAADGPLAYFGACLLPLLASDIVRILSTYHYSADRGLWRLFLALQICVSLICAALSCIPACLLRRYDLAMGLRHHAQLGLVLAVFNFAYFLAKPDWLVHDKGRVVMTPVQRILYNEWTLWSIYLGFLVLLIVRMYRRYAKKRASP